jgi:hypothetical protein
VFVGLLAESFLNFFADQLGEIRPFALVVFRAMPVGMSAFACRAPIPFDMSAIGIKTATITRIV